MDEICNDFINIAKTCYSQNIATLFMSSITYSNEVDFVILMA